jgi:hypothetical protein
MKTTLVTLALAAGSATAFVGGFMPKNSVAPTAARSHSTTTMFLNFGGKKPAAAPAKAPAGKAAPAKKVRARARGVCLCFGPIELAYV